MSDPPVLSALEVEWYAHLGADADLAHRLEAHALYPDDLIGLDHPQSFLFLDDPYGQVNAVAESNQDLDDDDRQLDELVRAYPAFDPAVLEAASSRPWTFHDIDARWHFPGPLSRRIALRDVGVHPEIAKDLDWTFESGAEMLDAIEAQYARTLVGPLRVFDDDLELTLSIQGAAVVGSEDSVRAYTALGGKPSLVLTIRDIWESLTAPYWPGSREDERLGYLDMVATEGAPDAPSRPVDHFRALRNGVILNRLRDVAPAIPSFKEAFAAEHHGADTRIEWL